MSMAQPSTRGIRALRAATATLPSSSAPISGHRPSQLQNRSFSSRPPRPAAPHSLAAQQTRPRQSLSSGRPLCAHDQLLQAQYQPAGSRRSFHFASLTNATVDAAEAAIAQLHAVTHTPWYITIPLVALGVNLVVRLPFTLHSHLTIAKQERLKPLLYAWAQVHTRAVDEKIKGEDRNAKLKETQSRLVETEKRLYKRFGLQKWKLYSSIMALPPWLVVIEALRRMSGAPTGLLGMLFRRDGDEAATAAAIEASTTAASAASASASAENVDFASFASAEAPVTSDLTDSVASLADQTFTTGGCLWFPDLTVADPYHVLPFALSAMLVMNIIPKSNNARRALVGLDSYGGMSTPMSRAQTALQRSLLLAALAVGPVTMNFPAAIHLYWLSSTISTYIIGRMVGVLWPIRKTRFSQSHGLHVPWIIPRAPKTKATEKK